MRDDGLGGKTLLVKTASSDDVEDKAGKKRATAREEDERDAQGPRHELVQVAPNQEWAQELREMRMVVADDVMSEMCDVKERTSSYQRVAWSSGPHRKVRRKQDGDCGQKTG